MEGGRREGGGKERKEEGEGLRKGGKEGGREKGTRREEGYEEGEWCNVPGMH